VCSGEGSHMELVHELLNSSTLHEVVDMHDEHKAANNTCNLVLSTAVAEHVSQGNIACRGCKAACAIHCNPSAA